MAIFIQGAGQPCPLCGKSLDEGPVRLFPAFLTNQKDHLYLFNDAAIHTRCLESNPMAGLAADMAADYMEKIKPVNRVCNVGGNRITKQDDWLFIDGLTSDKSEPVFSFNYKSFDRNNLGSGEWLRIKSELRQFYDSGKWENTFDPLYVRRLTSH